MSRTWAAIVLAFTAGEIVANVTVAVAHSYLLAVLASVPVALVVLRLVQGPGE